MNGYIIGQERGRRKKSPEYFCSLDTSNFKNVLFHYNESMVKCVQISAIGSTTGEITYKQIKINKISVSMKRPLVSKTRLLLSVPFAHRQSLQNWESGNIQG